MKVREMPQVMIRLNPKVKAWVEGKAKADERSQSWLIGKILEEAMTRDEQIKQA
ncbi:hypothetical protein QA447_07180 [Pseudomonas sp. abacavir_1]